MFIFGQALLQPLIGGECENVDRCTTTAESRRHGPSSCIACTASSLESVLAESLTRQSKDSINGHHFTNAFKMALRIRLISELVLVRL